MSDNKYNSLSYNFEELSIDKIIEIWEDATSVDKKLQAEKILLFSHRKHDNEIPSCVFIDIMLQSEEKTHRQLAKTRLFDEKEEWILPLLDPKFISQIKNAL